MGVSFQQREFSAAGMTAVMDVTPPEVAGGWRRIISAILNFI